MLRDKSESSTSLRFFFAHFPRVGTGWECSNAEPFFLVTDQLPARSFSTELNINNSVSVSQFLLVSRIAEGESDELDEIDEEMLSLDQFSFSSHRG
jgi:hypothetical protein